MRNSSTMLGANASAAKKITMPVGRKKKHPNAAIYSAALQTLRRRHQEEFNEIYAELRK